MNVLYDTNRACVACPMRQECDGPVPAEGPMDAEIALIGEAPGRNEDRRGRPWMGAAGQFLMSLLTSIGLTREDIWLSNMNKCRPKGNRTPTSEEAKFCADRWLSVELNMVKPKIIGLLGDVAISYFLGEGTVFERHGKPVLMSRETIHPDSDIAVPTWVLPMYHPAAGLYDKGEGMLARILEDFQVLGELARGTWKPVIDEHPNPIYSEGPLPNMRQPIAIDTEWVDNKLWSVQLSNNPGTASFVPADSWKVDSLEDQEIIVHSYMADAKMVNLPVNTKDTQLMAYLLGLPQGLKELAKRLCGMEMQSYQEMTREYGKEKAMAYLEEAAKGCITPDWNATIHTVPSTSQKRESTYPVFSTIPVEGVQGESFNDAREGTGTTTALVAVPPGPNVAVERTDWPDPPVLEDVTWNKKNSRFEIKSKTPQHISKKIKRILADVNGGKVNKHGPVDPYDRWTRIDGRERHDVEAVLGAIPEGNLEDAPRGHSIFYSSRDADATGRIYPILWQKILDKGLLPVFMMDMGTLPIALEMEKNGIKIDVQKLNELGDRFVGMLQEKSEEIFKGLNILCPTCVGVAELYGPKDKSGYYCNACNDTRIKRFNPNSNQELATLFFTDLGFTPTKHTPTGAPSVARGELAKIDHPVVGMIEEYRHVQHLKDSFCDTLPSKADELGRVHPTIKTTRTATGRWSMEDPNCQQIPSRDEEGKKIREAFIAEEGNVLVSIDYSQIEMRVQAHVAQCESMLQIFREGRHIHRETCAEVYGIPLADVNQDSPEYKATKNINFGVMYLETEAGLFTQMKREKAQGWDLQRCAQFIKDVYKLRPELWSWQQETIAFARRNGYVKDMWGRIRKIPECLVPVEWVQSQGDRQAVNMPIQGGAQGILKQAMVKISQERPWWLTNGARWLLQVHDELIWEVERPLVSRFIEETVPTMENIVKLSVPLEVEAKVGLNWGQMKKA